MEVFKNHFSIIFHNTFNVNYYYVIMNCAEIKILKMKSKKKKKILTSSGNIHLKEVKTKCDLF